MLPVCGYLILFGLSVLLRLSMEFVSQIGFFQVAGSLLGIAYVFMAVIIIVGTSIFMMVRFARSLTRDEGYLMHMLPADAHQHILTKLINAIMWSVSSVVAVALTVLVLVGSKAFFDKFAEYFNIAKDWLALSNLSLTEILLMVLLCLFIVMISQYLMIFAAISMGQVFRRHRVAGMVGSYFVLYVVNQVVMAAFIGILNGLDIFSRYASFPETGLPYDIIFIYMGIIAALSVLYFFVSHLALKFKLNLE